MPNSRHPERHVAIFFHSFTGGGAEKVMLALADHFRSAGCSVDLVVTRATGDLRSEVPAGACVHDLGVSRILFSLPGLMRYMRARRPGVVLSSQTFTNCIAIWARKLARAKAPLVVSEHSVPSVAAANGNTLQERIIPHLIRLFYRYADAVVAVSDAVARDLTGKCEVPERLVKVIYNPVVNATLAERAAEPLDHPWFAADAPPVVLGVGRLVTAKDFAILISAFAIVRQQRTCRLLILGEGPHRKRLEELVEAHGLSADVDLPGFAANPYKYMKRCGVFVLSSKWEGFANVVVEALACGAPVVSTDCIGGPSEILENGRWGKLVEVADAEAMADAILSVLDNPPPNGVERAAHFTAERAGEAYLRLLESPPKRGR